jgi:hypothetical protein
MLSDNRLIDWFGQRKLNQIVLAPVAGGKSAARGWR